MAINISMEMFKQKIENFGKTGIFIVKECIERERIALILSPAIA